MGAIQQVLLSEGFSGPSDPNYANVSLLLHGEGTNGSTTFTDNSSSPKTPTIVGSGSVAISTAQFKFGSASILFTVPGALSYTDAAFTMGTGDYTLECFARASNVSSRLNTLFELRTSTDQGVQFWMGGGVFGESASPHIGCSSNSAVLLRGGTVAANTWHHLALCRSGSTLYGFVDGVQAFSSSVDGRNYAATTIRLGMDYSSTSTQEFAGHMDEVRITKGVARYTAAFTPPSAAFFDH